MLILERIGSLAHNTLYMKQNQTQTITVSATYSLKWQLKSNPNFKISTCGKMFNCKRNKEVKRTLNGSSVGFWIESKFYTLQNLRKEIELITEVVCPF